MITNQRHGFSCVASKLVLKTVSKKNYRNILSCDSIVETNGCSFPERLLQRIHLFAYVSSDLGVHSLAIGT